MQAGAERLAHWFHESVTPEYWDRALEAVREIDLSSRLPEVRAPTLVLHRKDLGIPRIGEVRRLAIRIPNARLRLLDGVSLLPWIGDVDGVVEAIERHLNS